MLDHLSSGTWNVLRSPQTSATSTQFGSAKFASRLLKRSYIPHGLPWNSSTREPDDHIIPVAIAVLSLDGLILSFFTIHLLYIYILQYTFMRHQPSSLAPTFLQRYTAFANCRIDKTPYIYIYIPGCAFAPTAKCVTYTPKETSIKITHKVHIYSLQRKTTTYSDCDMAFRFRCDYLHTWTICIVGDHTHTYVFFVYVSSHTYIYIYICLKSFLTRTKWA